MDSQLLVKSLPTAIARQLQEQGATTIEDIFKANGPLDRALSWCDFELLEKIVSKFGDNKCKKELNKYTEMLGEYLQERSRIVEKRNSQELQVTLPDTTESQFQIVVKSSNETHYVELLIDGEWEEMLIRNKTSKRYIACLLGTVPSHVYFTHVNSIS